MDKPNYYAVIPASVRYDKDLSDGAKLLFGEITALTHLEGYCWATNEYFASLYDVDERTISRWISDLIKKEHIKLLPVQGGRQICLGGVDKNVVGGWTKMSTLNQEKPQKDDSTEPQKITQEASNTTYNNTRKTRTAEKSASPISFEEWLQSQLFEYRQSKRPDENDCYPDVWYSPDGKQLTSSQVAKLRRDYTKSNAPQRPQDDSGRVLTEQVGKVLDWISFDFQNAFGEVPLFNNKDKEMIRNLIKRTSFDFVKEYGRWFFSDPQVPDKFKVGVTAFCSTNFINQYKSQKHGRSL